jgi:hypothetical protein
MQPRLGEQCGSIRAAEGLLERVKAITEMLNPMRSGRVDDF